MSTSLRLPRRLSRASIWISLATLCGIIYLVYNFQESIQARLPQDWKKGHDKPTPMLDVPSTQSSDDQKRNAVVDAFKHAWRAYEHDAMGSDEYHPISHSGSNISRSGGFGYTVVDALDTMYIMGLQDDYNRARRWVRDQLSFDREGVFSTFETTIRVLGGLLAMYHLTEDKLYLKKSVDLGNRLISAFDTSSGMPWPSVNLAKSKGVPDRYAPDRLSTAEAATLQLEFRYLAELTGHEHYWLKAEAVMYMIDKALKASTEYNGLVPIYMSVDKASFVHSEIRLGSRGDSYYEYLLKQYLQTGRREPVYRQMYEESMQGLHDRLVQKTYRHKLTYIAELIPSVRQSYALSPKQDHLVCFLAGSLMLGATTTGAKASVSVPPKMSELTKTGQRDWQTGVALLETCMDTHKTETGLSPEIVMLKTDSSTFDKGEKEQDWYIKNSKKGGPRSYDARYMLRPETVESLFIAWRLTRNIRYRNYAWAVFTAIEKHCKLPDGGYATVLDVDTLPVSLENKQETFFLSETLKYLYLTFADDAVLPLSKYVFNTEAHPLPIFESTIHPAFGRALQA